MENRTSFGLDADAYRSFRPVYPDSLYKWLAGQCAKHDAALDCATGNGQAALALTRYFKRVVATDTDAAQIASAERHAQIEYVVVAAEALPATLGEFDLVTIAQGAHWFELDAFYTRLQPLLAPRAVVAIWGYSHARTDTAIDELLQQYLVAAVDPFWAQGNRVIMDHYRSIAFPFEELAAPAFEICEHWDRETFFGYARTWSAYKRLIAAGGSDPLPELAAALDAQGLWLNAAKQRLVFDLYLRVGRGS